MAEATGLNPRRFSVTLAQAAQKGKANVTCHNCKIEASKFGFFGRQRIQRFRCKQCGKTFADIPERPLEDLRVPFDKAVQIVNLLVEGCGIRAIERLANVHRDTVMAVLEVAGQKAARLMDARVHNHPFQFVQVDELFCFVKFKERNNHLRDRNAGEQYVFLGIDSDSKFIINHTVGKRTAVTCQEFMLDLRQRVKAPFQLSADGFSAYKTEVDFTFLNEIHFAQVVKEYANPLEHDFTDRKYSPSPFVAVHKTVICGNPCKEHISTSYVERTNLSVRIFNRRFTRLTLGFSKKLGNLKHSTALMIAHFNFCRVHSAVKIKATATTKAIERTPAMAANLSDHVWTIAELLWQA
jgi:transposase-like protein/IS1 family transposase